MLDIRLFREDPDLVRAKLQSRRENPALVDEVLAVDEARRSLLQRVESLKARRNEISKEIPRLSREGQPIAILKDESKGIGETITQLEESLRKIDAKLDDMLMRIPNLPQDSVPVGEDDKANRIVRTWGEPVKHPFPAKQHDELGTKLGILDLPRGAKLAGSGFYTMKGAGARLERALVDWMIEMAGKNGYTELSVPFIVNRATMTGTGQLPKFEADMYRVDSDDLFLVPTAEVPVTNMHAQEILEADQLPIAYCAFTPCFRREAGSAGRENRGISRIHQFFKVELVHITKPTDSYTTHEQLVRNASGLLEALNIPYRVVELCTGDIGFSASKCFDLEIWAPGMQTWLEVSSCSNFEDFQARRAGIRFRPEKGAKPQFCHTLNGSGLALPRLVIALLENNQREDGSVVIPEPLRSRMGTDLLKA